MAQESGRLEIVLATWLGDLRQLVELGALCAQPLLVSNRSADSEAFAAELLLPSQVLISNAGTDGISRSQLVELAARYRVSWSLAPRQPSHVGVLDSDSQRAMARVRPTRSEFLDALGWAPQPDLASIRVPPGYAHAVLEALQRGAVTPSRAVELMRGQVSLADLPADDEADDEP